MRAGAWLRTSERVHSRPRAPRSVFPHCIQRAMATGERRWSARARRRKRAFESPIHGAGHLYAGKPWQAVTAFALNGLFLAGAAYAIHEKLELTGAILLFFETGWSLGGIKSAMDAARDANRQQQKAFADRLRTTYAPPVLTLQVLQAPGLGLRLTF